MKRVRRGAKREWNEIDQLVRQKAYAHRLRSSSRVDLKPSGADAVGRSSQLSGFLLALVLAGEQGGGELCGVAPPSRRTRLL